MSWATNLYIPGRPNCSNLEKAADLTLSFPSSLWEGKNVKILDNQELKYTNQGKIGKCFSDAKAYTKGFVNPFEYSIGIPMFLGVKLAETAVSAVALPFDLIGKGLKASALEIDSVAKTYNKLSREQLKTLTTIDETTFEVKELEKRLSKSEMTLDELKDLYTFLDETIQESPSEIIKSNYKGLVYIIRPLFIQDQVYDHFFNAYEQAHPQYSMRLKNLQKYIG